MDARLLPGEEEAALATLQELAGPGVSIEPEHRDVALETPFSGDLVELSPDRPLDVPLYWQHWKLHSPALDALTDAVRDTASAALRPPGRP